MGTVQAVGLLILAVVPGAVLTFSYERHAGPLAGDSNEWTLRFLMGTAIVFPLTATLAVWTYTHVVNVPVGDPPTEFRNRLSEPSDFSLWWTFVPLAYVISPWLLGRLAGAGRVALRRRSVKNRASSLVPGLAAWSPESSPTIPSLPPLPPRSPGATLSRWTPGWSTRLALRLLPRW